MLDDQHLGRFLKCEAISATLVYSDTPTPTVATAASALGVELTDIIKSLVFLANDQPYLLIIAGESRVDMKLLRDALQVSRRKLRMASSEEALDLSGFPPGAMPPFGHRQVLPTLVDANTINADQPTRLLYGGGGSRSAMLKLTVEILLAVTQARLYPLT